LYLTTVPTQVEVGAAEIVVAVGLVMILVVSDKVKEIEAIKAQSLSLSQ
jgi:hypothetical protein